jgi:hypothetical protein
MSAVDMDRHSGVRMTSHLELKEGGEGKEREKEKGKGRLLDPVNLLHPVASHSSIRVPHSPSSPSIRAQKQRDISSKAVCDKFFGAHRQQSHHRKVAPGFLGRVFLLHTDRCAYYGASRWCMCDTHATHTPFETNPRRINLRQPRESGLKTNS